MDLPLVRASKCPFRKQTVEAEAIKDVVAKRDHAMPFGKHRGKSFDEIPIDYKVWAAGLYEEDLGRYQDLYAKIEDSLFPIETLKKMVEEKAVNTGFEYIYMHHKDTIVAIREHLQNKCLICGGGYLQPFKITCDWESRRTHKKCYIERIKRKHVVAE